MSSTKAQPRHSHRSWQTRWIPAATAWRSGGQESAALPLLQPAAVPLASRAPSTSGRAWIKFYRRGLRCTDILVVLLATACGIETEASADLSAGAGVPIGGGGSVVFAAGVALLWAAFLVVYRTRESTILGVGSDEYKRVVAATLNVFGLAAMVAVLTQRDAAGAMFLVGLPVGILGLAGSRWIWRQWINSQRLRGHYLSRVVVSGEPEDVRYVIRQLNRKSGATFEVLGTLVPGGTAGTSLRIDNRDVPILGGLNDIVPAVQEAGATAVIVAGPMPGGNNGLRELGWMLEEHQAELVLASNLTNVAGPRMHLRQVEGLPLMHVDLPRYAGGKHRIKRAMDVVLAAGALLALAPVFLVLALIVRSDSPGPSFFRQERVGKDGKRFYMLKFRSMVESAEDDLNALMAQNQAAGVLFKIQHDPRITRCGRWMRKYSLDELPQFWNVLRGDMSMVGPRPPLPREVELYERNINRRLLTKPGITGLWQIGGRSDLPWEDAVRLDLYYVENWSMWGDMVILWRTLKVVISPEGAY